MIIDSNTGWRKNQTIRHFKSTNIGWHQSTARHVVSHTVVIVLCTKLDAECNRQATVVGRKLTTLGVDRCRREIILSSELQRELHLCLEAFVFRICFINVIQLQYDDDWVWCNAPRGPLVSVKTCLNWRVKSLVLNSSKWVYTLRSVISYLSV